MKKQPLKKEKGHLQDQLEVDIIQVEENLIEKKFGHLEPQWSKTTKLENQWKIQEGKTFPDKDHQYFQKKEKDQDSCQKGFLNQQNWELFPLIST